MQQHTGTGIKPVKTGTTGTASDSQDSHISQASLFPESTIPHPPSGWSTLSLQKGAFQHAFLVLFISMLVFLILKYQISKFSHRWQAYDRALQRNQHKMQLLSGEKWEPTYVGE